MIDSLRGSWARAALEENETSAHLDVVQADNSWIGVHRITRTRVTGGGIHCLTNTLNESPCVSPARHKPGSQGAVDATQCGGEARIQGAGAIERVAIPRRIGTTEEGDEGHESGGGASEKIATKYWRHDAFWCGVFSSCDFFFCSR